MAKTGATEFSARGKGLIKSEEKLVLRVYPDSEGNPTIGWGHRLRQANSFPNGIDEPLAEHIFLCDCDEVEEAINHLVFVPLTQNQFDALGDFTFNLGEGALAGSTLLTLLNQGRYDDAALQLLRWDHAHVKGKVVELEGLKKRRQREFALWHDLDPVDPAKAQEVAA